MSELPVLIILLFAIAFLFRVDFIFYVAYVCLGIYGWSLWTSGRALKKIQVSRRYDDRSFPGQPVPVRLTIRNQSRLPLPWLRIHEGLPLELRPVEPVDQALALAGHETIQLSYTVRPFKRGYYRLGPATMWAGDQFGFWEQTARARPNYLTVYPHIWPLARLGLPSRLPFGTLRSRQRLFEDPARPLGVRDFRSGDSLRQINWKASARYSQRALQVKTFEPAISLETAILLNLNAADYAYDRYHGPEWAVEVAASLAAHLVDQRQAVGLMTNGSDPLAGDGDPEFDEVSGRLTLGSEAQGAPNVPAPIPPRPGRSHLMKLLELLARVEAGASAEFNAWAPRVTVNLSWGVTLLAVTPNGDETTSQAMHRLARAGYNPVLIVTAPLAGFDQVRERARRLGFAAFRVTEPDELRGWQQR